VDLEENPSGEKVSIASKELGHTDIYPSYLRHSPNSHYFALCNQTEFAVIKTASFKSVVLGSGTSLVWHSDNDFAVLDNDVINIYSNQEYSSSIKLPFPPKKITEGYLLGAIGPESVLLYDWDRIEAPIHDLHLAAQKIWWN
jgi:coatomer subunit beta'